MIRKRVEIAKRKSLIDMMKSGASTAEMSQNGKDTTSHNDNHQP